MGIKIRDKVRVTTVYHPYIYLRGSICTVVNVYEWGVVKATIDGGDSFRWFLHPCEYELITGTENRKMEKKLDEMTVKELEDFVFNVMDDALDYDTNICDLALAVAKALKSEMES